MRVAAPRVLGVLALFVCHLALAAPPPIEDFAHAPALSDVAISPDGHYLSGIGEYRGQHGVMVMDRVKATPPQLILSVKRSEAFDVRWCAWANGTRLLCGLVGSVTQTVVNAKSFTHISQGKFKYATTRLIGIDMNGGNLKVLVQDSYAGVAQFQDRILDWTPAEPESVLIQLDPDGDGFPGVYELNVNNGNLTMRMPAHPPIVKYWTDAKGEVRFGAGVKDTRLAYYARLLGSEEWRPLSTLERFARPETLSPLVVLAGKNRALAIGESNGHQALWEIDIEDKLPPKLVFEDAQFDVDRPILSSSGRLLGVYYENDRPHTHYMDARTRSVIEGTDKFLANTFNWITDVTPDEKVYVLRSDSDIDAGSYHVLDVSSGQGDLDYLGAAYPELARQPLGRMMTIDYTARDGTHIQGYLTVPPGAEEKNLPLIVMPHGGPILRDSWQFDFLRLFLASRGYAVLQMNFRGSGGLGWQWFHAAHQDWGGLTYDDIIDGARWAAAKGIADPKRMAMVGWSFGGYASMLGAVRNGDLFRCAVSIAGVSDLVQLLDESQNFMNWKAVREQVGVNREKLVADSPLRHASEVSIPLLLIHGTEDWTVLPEQSEKMAAALRRAGKPHELLLIKGGDHELGWRSERIEMLTSIEKFLAASMGQPGT